MCGKLKNSREKVEAMILENNARTVRRDGQLDKEGPILYDPMLNESYVITEKPLLAYRKNKSTPVYLVDRDSGVTVTMTRTAGTGTQAVEITEGNPEEKPGEKKPLTLKNILDKIAPTEPERIVIENPEEIIINGRRFGGWTVRLERSEQLIRLNTDPSLVGRGIASRLIGDAFSPPLSNREKLVMLLAGAIIGMVIGLMF